jgi:capsular exopolysaccharide synthesis family protein
MASEAASRIQRPQRVGVGAAPGQAHYRGVDGHLTSLINPSSPDAEQYRLLRHMLEQLRIARGVKLVAVTSAAAGDGKTTTALNVAGALAQNREARVLVVDGDLRRPSVARRLGMGDDGPGLVEAILDPARELSAVVRQRPAFNLSILPAGRCPTITYDILRSPRIPRLLAQARDAYDYVILDTPPVLALADSRVIADWVDGLLMVVTADRTPRKLVAEALSVLDPAKVLGIVLNGDRRPLAGYYKSYYNTYSQPRRRTGGGGS